MVQEMETMENVELSDLNGSDGGLFVLKQKSGF
jgi:hypothetical protein